MSFQVIWAPEAERRLTQVWLNNPAARALISAASHQIDVALANDPEEVGESRPEGRRIVHVAPLGAIYRVDHDTRIVTVTTLWYFEHRAR
jgi:hypothetical protein